MPKKTKELELTNDEKQEAKTTKKATSLLLKIQMAR